MKKLFYIICLCQLFSLKNYAQHSPVTMSHDKPSTHGMLIFGTNKIYASHLPMFHSPHNYQFILELSLSKAALQKFIADQKAHPEFTTYTIEPEKFVLPNMVNLKGSFKANLYRGHFERGGIKIADSIVVKINAVIYGTQFNESIIKDNEANFILFGNSKEQFAVHKISKKPDFEQIIQVQTTISKMETVSLGIPNNAVGVSGNTIKVKLNNKMVNVTLLKQLYLEFDDLKE